MGGETSPTHSPPPHHHHNHTTTTVVTTTTTVSPDWRRHLYNSTVVAGVYGNGQCCLPPRCPFTLLLIQENQARDAWTRLKQVAAHSTRAFSFVYAAIHEKDLDSAVDVLPFVLCRSFANYCLSAPPAPASPPVPSVLSGSLRSFTVDIYANMQTVLSREDPFCSNPHLKHFT